MSDEQAFLNALTANPADDVCRLAYSDWLEEREEIGKATCLRLVVRAVEQIANGEELSDVREGLWPFITTLEEDWRNAVGRRFDVRLEVVRPERKILAIKTIREMTMWGLGEAKWFVESHPVEMTLGCTLEVTDFIQKHIQTSDSASSAIIIAQPSPPKRESIRDLNLPHRIRLVFDRADDGTDYNRDFAEFQRIVLEYDPAATIDPVRREVTFISMSPRAGFHSFARLAPIRPGWSHIPTLMEWRKRLRELHNPPSTLVGLSLDLCRTHREEVLTASD